MMDFAAGTGLSSGSNVDFEAVACWLSIWVFVSWLAATWLALSKSSGLSLTDERASPSPLDVEIGPDCPWGAAAEACCFSERSTGLSISSKSELSSSRFSSSLASVNLEARSLMEDVCSFIDGGGPRSAETAWEGLGSSSGAFLTGEGALGEGARAVGL